MRHVHATMLQDSWCSLECAGCVHAVITGLIKIVFVSDRQLMFLLGYQSFNGAPCVGLLSWAHPPVASAGCVELCEPSADPS